MFSTLYEITTYGHIAKQVFAKIPNSIILTLDATKEKVKWAAWSDGKESPHRFNHSKADGGVKLPYRPKSDGGSSKGRNEQEKKLAHSRIRQCKADAKKKKPPIS